LTISKELEAKILRYHFVEHWGPHTIATQLGVHHSAVDRVLSQAGMPKAERARQASIIDPYLPFIIETLEQYPKLTATRDGTIAHSDLAKSTTGLRQPLLTQSRRRVAWKSGDTSKQAGLGTRFPRNGLLLNRI